MGTIVEKEAQRKRVLISCTRYNKVCGSSRDDVEVCPVQQSHSMLLHHIGCVDLGHESL